MAWGGDLVESGVSVTLDIATLSFVVTLVMLVASISLIVHWLANISIGGLGEVSRGVVALSFGNCVLFANPLDGGTSVALFGETLILIGYMWVWLGISDFWEVRQPRIVLLASSLVLLAVSLLVYKTVTGDDIIGRSTTLALFISALSVGIVLTLVHALGGQAGFYKGIVRRTTVGVGVAAGLFVIHALYGLYQALVLNDIMVGMIGPSIPLYAVTHLEALVFVMILVMAIIIMTAERLQAELKIQEMMDPLTRALNRRAFLEVMKAVLARARRLAEPVSLLMVDIDRFKRINLKHGRAIGDKALAEFVDLVMEGRRNQDVFCRFGGEEFVLMLPGTPEEGVDLVAARVKARIENMALMPNGVPIKLTVSMGVVTARGDDLDADGMLDVVDRRTLRAQKLRFEKIESAG